MPSCLFLFSPPACDTRTQIVEEADTGKVKCVDRQPDLISNSSFPAIRWKVPKKNSVGGVSGLKFTSWKIWFKVVAWPPNSQSWWNHQLHSGGFGWKCGKKSSPRRFGTHRFPAQKWIDSNKTGKSLSASLKVSNVSYKVSFAMLLTQLICHF